MNGAHGVFLVRLGNRQRQVQKRKAKYKGEIQGSFTVFRMTAASITASIIDYGFHYFGAAIWFGDAA
jgi:thiamine transporter ThiT